MQLEALDTGAGSGTVYCTHPQQENKLKDLFDFERNCKCSGRFFHSHILISECLKFCAKLQRNSSHPQLDSLALELLKISTRKVFLCSCFGWIAWKTFFSVAVLKSCPRSTRGNKDLTVGGKRLVLAVEAFWLHALWCCNIFPNVNRGSNNEAISEMVSFT